jgi:hypothetical protein
MLPVGNWNSGGRTGAPSPHSVVDGKHIFVTDWPLSRTDSLLVSSSWRKSFILGLLVRFPYRLLWRTNVSREYAVLLENVNHHGGHGSNAGPVCGPSLIQFEAICGLCRLSECVVGNPEVRQKRACQKRACEKRDGRASTFLPARRDNHTIALQRLTNQGSE